MSKPTRSAGGHRRYTVLLGGMDDRAVPAENTAKTISDLQWNAEGYWEPVWGAVEVSNFANGTGAISAVHWFQPRPNQRWLVVERRIDENTSRISYVDFPAGGTPTDIVSRRRLDSSDLGTTFMDNGRWLWILSPVDALVRWDGERVAPVGFAGPAPPPNVFGPLQGQLAVDEAGLNYGAVSFSDLTQRGVGPEAPSAVPVRWVYAYGATQLNDLGQESPMSPIQILVGQNPHLPISFAGVRSSVQLAYPHSASNVRGVRLWRSRNLVGIANPAEGVDMYLLQSFVGAHEFDWLDIAEDSELGELFNRAEVGATPTGARAMATWAGATWLAGMPEAPTILRHSTAGFPEQFGDLNYIPIGTAATGPIVALHPIGRAMLVFKTGGIYLVKGDLVNGFRAEELDGTKGTESPRAIVTVPGIGTLFLDPKAGPHAVVGTFSDDTQTNVRSLAEGIRKLWNRRVGVLLGQAVVVYDPSRDEVWWQLPEGGNTRTSLGIVLHTGTAHWSVRQDWDIGAFAFYKGRVWMGSNEDTAAPGVFLLSAGSRERMDGSAITGIYTTNPLRLQEEPWLYLWVEGVGLAMGRSTWSISTRSGQKPDQVSQAENDPRQQHPTHQRDVWGTGKWDLGSTNPEYTDYELAAFPVSVRVELAKEQVIRISSTRMRMAHLDLIVPTPAEQPRPLERR